MCKGSEVRDSYLPTLSRSLLKHSIALCPPLLFASQSVLCTVASVICLKLLFYGRAKYYLI